MRLGALETGGTKMVCALGNEKGEILEQISIPTELPETTLPKVMDYFKDQEIDALGIASFGPLDLHRESPTYGYITSTPKLGWKNTPIVSAFKDALQVPVGFDTDVNGSLLGEVTYGAYQGIENAVYLTIGTGIGAGIITNGKLLHGMLHAEAGHIPLPKHPEDTFAGVCPYHGACFEGLASGPAMEKRWGMKAEMLNDNKEAWELEAFYIAEALASYIMILSPEKIILGGGVMHQEKLFPLIREKTSAVLNGYLHTNEVDHMDSYIVAASLGDNQGIKGCLKLAYDALKEEQS